MRCSKLEDVSPLINWPISNSNKTSGMFYGANKVIKDPLKNWKISQENFKKLFKDTIY